MRKFISKSLLFLTISITIFFVSILLTSIVVKNRGFNNYTSDSNTLFMGDNEKYDILIAGISHARNFSRYNNHKRVENILDSDIINIGQGRGACSINEQLFYLNYFYTKGNTASNTILILSPPMLFSETLPIASNTFDYETFNFSFFWNYLKFDSENKTERILSYLESKLDPVWIMKQPKSKQSMDKSLDSLDLKTVAEGQDLAYSGKGLNYDRFEISKQIVENIIKLSGKNNSKVHLIIPPALFGKWRGHEETKHFALEMTEKFANVELLDASETVLEPKYYYDNHHLNTKGVVYFTNRYLKQLEF